MEALENINSPQSSQLPEFIFHLYIRVEEMHEISKDLIEEIDCLTRDCVYWNQLDQKKTM